MAVADAAPPAAGWTDAAVAGALAARRDELVALWERLGSAGPTFGQEIEPEPEAVRRGFLTPLARMLAAAVGGSALHRAGYLDGRLAYLPKALPGAQRSATLAPALAAEEDAIAAALAATVDPARTRAALRAVHAPLVAAPAPGDPRLLLVGDCVFSDVRVFLAQDVAAQTGRFPDSDHIYFSAGISPLRPEDVRRAIDAAPPTLIGLSLFSYHGVPAYTGLMAEADGLDDATLQARADTLVGLLATSVAAIREVTDATLMVHTSCSLPVTPRRQRIRLLRAETRGQRRLHACLGDRVAALVSATENALLVDEQRLIAAHGGLRRVARDVLGPEYRDAYAHPTSFGPVLAAEYAGVLADHAVVGRAKALLVDFDNTLWDGVMGEGAVVHHPDRQRRLRELKQAGILLVALSKNDPDAIRWDELELAPEDFVLHQVNWRPKPDNASEAIAALDLAPEAFVLLDDNPVERALVVETVPGVRALDPTQPATWRTLERWLAFPSTGATEEARRRTTLYREAAERRQVMSGAHDYAAMMASLDLRADLRPAGADDLPRLLELVNRTNQFNTTTRRRSGPELQALMAAPDRHLLVASLADRFGDLGIVALVVVLEQADGSAELDALIMSCRAMGFGLEQLVLAGTVERLGARRYVAPFVATERNGPAAALYPSSGFVEEQPGRWVLDDLSRLPGRPGWFAGR